MRMCYKWEQNAHTDGMLNILTSKNLAKLKQNNYYYAEFLEEI